MSDSDTEHANGVDSTGTFETMVIRAWIEPGHEDGFRARLTVADESGKPGSPTVTSAPADVIDAVRAWLAKVQASENGPQASFPPGEPER
jgi:hypothetical protein